MNLFKKLVAARLPPAAVGLAGEGAGLVALERRRGAFAVKRAGYVAFPEGLVRPGFDEPNVSDAGEFADLLAELVTTTGLQKRRRWSVALPEAATRTSILTLESAPASRTERDEMLRWKAERALGAPLDELRVGRVPLRPDAQGRGRHLLTAVRLSVLAGYEEAFAALGWQTGLMLPRHMGEAWWLMNEPGARSLPDSLLVSSHGEGFTAVVLRGGEPLYVRCVVCEPEDKADELYRFLLFYRDRNAARGEDGADILSSAETIDRVLVAGQGLAEAEAGAIVAETLSMSPRALSAQDLRLSFPARDLDFHSLAAPAGLAALAWA
ncbi:MAG TPA: hypothetical protein VER32_08880 [Pyrinomonadaceae bacterium]|nr:hypothetical protein [Pyrinomonadaceae bacterium]